uniref:phosphopantetheine-binding protein n=1 Tax=Gracilibacillus dipsosauri TaxID=178340 RepID=UPI002409AA2B
KPRRGAVSAFGMSGTNVHLVVESYSKEERDEKGTSLPYYLLALSAKTEEALAEKVTDLIAYLEGPEGQKADLLQVSYTLLHGRQHFRHRWAMIVHQKEDALYALKRAINKENTPNLFHGVVPSMFTSQTALMKYITSLLEQNKDARKDPQQYQENLMALATMYCQGYEIDSEALFFGTNAKSLHMPTYPFARNNYWVESKEPDMRYSIRETIDSPSPNEDPTTKSLRNEPKKDHGEASKQYALQHLSTPEIDTWSSVPIAKPESIQLTGVKDKSRGNEHSETSDIEEIEKSIAMLLKEVLDLDQENVDRDMPFIEMGMDSIVGVEWIQAVNNQYQTSFTANSIYEFPNIRKFATALAQSSSGFAEDAIDGENESKIDSTLPIEPIDKPNDSPTLNNTEEVISYLVESLAESLSMDKKEIKLDSELVELGLDSIIGVEWIQAINERYGLTLTANSIYEYPYLREFADFILGQLSMENELDNSSPLHLQQLVKSVQAGEIDIEQADQLLQRGDIKK